MEARRHYSRQQVLSISCLLALGTFAVYSRTLGHEFINFDDDQYVYQNADIQRGFSLETLRWVFGFHFGNWHPLTWLSHVLDCRLYGLKPWGHHLTSVLIHTVNAVLLFLALRKMTGALWRSACVAALFAVHPTHVESVAWVAERKDVLSGFFGLLTLWFYAAYAEVPGWKRYLPVVFFFSLGLMSKSMLVTWPFVLLLLDFWPLRRLSFADGADVSRFARQLAERVWEKIPLFLLIFASSTVTYLAQKSGGALVVSGLDERAGNALTSYVAYAWETVWPAHLAVYYPLHETTMVQGVGAGALVVAAVTGAVLTARSHPHLLVGGLWFLGTLVPVIGLVQIGGQAMADRYTYLPTIGLLIAATWAGNGLRERWRVGKKMATVATCSVLVIFAAACWVQIGYWRDTVTLFGQAARVVPKNYVAHFKLGEALLGQNKIPESAEQFALAVQYGPPQAKLHFYLGHALVELGRYDEAMPHLQFSLTLEPARWEPYAFIGDALARQGKTQEAIANYLLSLERNPGYTRARHNLALIFLNTGRLEEAALHFTEAVRANPKFWEARINLSLALMMLGRADEAERHLLEALRIDSARPEGHHFLGVILAKKGRIEEARDHLQEALRRQPDFASSRQILDALAR
jgi:tetratricopeptide (TPR) repeat protein